MLWLERKWLCKLKFKLIFRDNRKKVGDLGDGKKTPSGLLVNTTPLTLLSEGFLSPWNIVAIQEVSITKKDL